MEALAIAAIASAIAAIIPWLLPPLALIALMVFVLMSGSEEESDASDRRPR